MKLFITFLLLFSLSNSSISQIKNNSVKNIPDSVNMAAIILIEDWNFLVHVPNGQAYIANTGVKINNLVQMRFMLYYPSFTDVDKHTYKNVLVKDSVVFDCVTGMHKICSRKFYSDFSNLFNSEVVTNAQFVADTHNSIWIKALNYSCNLNH